MLYGLFRPPFALLSFFMKLNLIQFIYISYPRSRTDWASSATDNNEEEEKKEEGDPRGETVTESTLQSSGVLFGADEMTSFDYAGAD